MALAFGAAVAGGPAGALAETQDFELWPAVVITALLGDAVDLKVDALLELSDDGSRANLELVRVILLRRLDDRLSVGGGYTWGHGDPAHGSTFNEHRAVQEADVRLARTASGATLSARTRLEERYRERQRGVAIRLRQQLRVEAPFPVTEAHAVVWSEYFHALNGTRWSGSAGSKLMLTFVGVRAPLTRSLAIEPGYLNQVTFAPGRNRVTHVASLTLALRF